MENYFLTYEITNNQKFFEFINLMEMKSADETRLRDICLNKLRDKEMIFDRESEASGPKSLKIVVLVLVLVVVTL